MQLRLHFIGEDNAFFTLRSLSPVPTQTEGRTNAECSLSSAQNARAQTCLEAKG